MIRHTVSVGIGAMLTISAAMPQLAQAASALTTPSCRPATTTDARAVVQRAISALGLSSVGESVRTATVTDVLNMPYQSDRMYPPYLWTSREMRLAMDWRRGTHRAEQGTPPNSLTFISDSARRAAVSSRGAMLLPRRQPLLLDERAMDPWAVLADWREAPDVRVIEQCMYRDYWRIVLGRATPEGAERLYVDPKTGIPTKLERREAHYLWGDVSTEYLWSIWSPVKGSQAVAPQFAYRLVDGFAAMHVPLSAWSSLSRFTGVP